MKIQSKIDIKDREIALDDAYEKLLEIGFGSGSLEDAPEFIDRDVMGYGTALDEKIMSYQNFCELIVAQRKQADKFDEFIYRSNPVLKRLFNSGNSALIVDEIDLTTIIEGETNKMTVRMSTVLEYQSDSWVIVHWHGSLADHISDGSDPWHVDEWKKKNAELEKAVEEKTTELLVKNRELEIETALERVRAVAMGMQKSDDLLIICKVSYNEFEKLGFPGLRTVLIHIHDDENRSFTDYDYCDLLGGQISTLNYESHPLVVEFLKQTKSSEDAFAEAVFSGEELQNWKKIRIETGQKDDPRLNDIDALYYYGYSIGVGDFTISTLKPINQEQTIILRRFRNVFNLAYRRYNDIALAEAQTRESQIEASLERVRAQAMAMHNSEDLALTIDVFFHELKSLNVSPIRCGVGIKEGDSRVVEVTVTSATKNDKEIKITGKLKLGGHPILDKIYDALQQQSEYFPVLRGNEINEYYQAMNPDIEFPNFSEDDIQYGYYFNFREGGLFAWTEKQLPEDDLTIFRRFKSVLSLTYRRYLDLKEAEAQAREGQVQLALEKVRLVALGLKKSEEMLEVAKALYEQLIDLGFRNIRNAIIDLENGDGDTFTDYDYSHEMSGTITLMSYHDDPTLQGQFKKMATTTDDFFELRLEGKELQDLINMRLKNGEAPDPRLLKTELVTYNLLSFGNGAIGISNFGLLNEEEKVILHRFRNVFTFAYKRYNDLALAEAQAREAKIEASLERVRARAMAMHNSEDLSETIRVFFSELNDLDVKPRRCGVGIIEEETKISNIQASTITENNIVETISGKLKLSGHLVLDQIFTNWKLQKEYFPVLKGYEISEYYKVMNPQVTFPEYLDDEIQYGYYFSFKEGIVFAWTDTKLDNEEIQIFRKFTSVLSLTYRRYIDLLEAEAQAREAQIEAALERVRSLAVGMQQSDEVGKVSDALFSELQKLSVKVLGCTISVIDEAEDKMELWRARSTAAVKAFEKSSFAYSMRVFKKNMPNMYTHFINAWESKEKFMVNPHSFEERNQFISTVSELYNYDAEQKKKIEDSLPREFVSNYIFFKIGYLALLTKDKLSADELLIARRFAEVFDFTYTRFYDLKKAEAQNKIIQAENDRKTQELEEARKLQLAMLPKELPKLSKLDIAVFMQTATEVGGDYYDFSTKDDGSLNICLGDATGHGLKAGTLVSMIKSLFVADSVRLGVQEFFDASNKTLKKMALSQMMMAFAMVNIHGDEIKISNAGIPPIYIFRKMQNEVEEVNLNGLPIGAIRNAKYEVYKSKLNSGDIILMLSDGMPELQNEMNEMFGYERLIKIFKLNADNSSEGIITELVKESKSWSGNRETDDDITFVVIKIK